MKLPIELFKIGITKKEYFIYSDSTIRRILIKCLNVQAETIRGKQKKILFSFSTPCLKCFYLKKKCCPCQIQSTISASSFNDSEKKRRSSMNSILPGPNDRFSLNASRLDFEKVLSNGLG